MRVCVLPVPGGPWMSATSADPKANLMASFWESLSVGSFQVGSGTCCTGEEEVRLNNVRMKGVYSASCIF